MSRIVAVIVHALISIAAGAMYFFFVLPRWWELEGEISSTWGLVLRIITGLLIGLAALPVLSIWLRTRRPEFGTPELALRLRLCSMVLHVACGLLIILTAISEIWFKVGDAGRWLFGVYGAAAAIGLLGIFSFYLAFVAEMPPPPPRPLKTTERKSRWRRRKDHDDTDAATDSEGQAEDDEDVVPEKTAEPVTDDAEETVEPKEHEDDAPAPDAEPTESDEASTDESAATEDEATSEDEATATETVTSDASRGGIRNRRPAGKIRRPKRFGKSGGGVAVDDE